MNKACERVVGLFTDIKFYLGLFNEGIKHQDGINISEAKELKSEIIQVVGEIEKRVKLASDCFLNLLEDSATLNSIKKIVETPSLLVGIPDIDQPSIPEELVERQIPSDLYEAIAGLFNDLPDRRFDSEVWQRFANDLVDSVLVRQLHSEFTIRTRDRLRQKLFAILNGIFLNRYLKKEELLEINSEIPSEFEDCYFGAFLQQGTIKVRGASYYHYLGYKARGGRIIADYAGDLAGACARKGTSLVIGRAGKRLGSNSSANIVAESAESLGGIKSEVVVNRIVDSATGDPKPIKSTFLAEDGFSFGRLGTSYRYNCLTGEYSSPLIPRLIVISNQKDYDQIIGAGLLGVIHEIKSLQINPTKNFNKGILVLKEVPGIIGENMSAGIIILEDHRISLAEAKRRISPSKKGGLIMMRIRDALSLETRLELVG